MKTRYEIEELFDRIQYKGWKFLITSTVDNQYVWLQVEFVDGKDVWKGRKWLLSKYATNSELIQTAFKAVLTAEEHETREKFLFDGVAVLGPHLNLPWLAEEMKADKAEETVLDARD